MRFSSLQGIEQCRGPHLIVRQHQCCGGKHRHAPMLALPPFARLGQPVPERIDMPCNRFGDFLPGGCPYTRKAGLNVPACIDHDLDRAIGGKARHRAVEPGNAVPALRDTVGVSFEHEGFRGEPVEHLVQLAQTDSVLVASGQGRSPIIGRKRAFEHDIAEAARGGVEREDQRSLRRHTPLELDVARLTIEVSRRCFFNEAASVLPRILRSSLAACAITASSTLV